MTFICGLYHLQLGLTGSLVEDSSIHLGEMVQESPHVRRRRRGGRHVGPGGVVAVLVRRVLHLHHLPLRADEAVAPRHQHRVGVGVADLLSGASVLVGKTVEIISK